MRPFSSPRLAFVAIPATLALVFIAATTAAAQSGSRAEKSRVAGAIVVDLPSTPGRAVPVPPRSSIPQSPSTLVARRPGGLERHHRTGTGTGGNPLAPTRYVERADPFSPAASALPHRRASVRDAARYGLIGAGVGAAAGGVMELVDPHGEIADVWPVLLAVPGFFGGVIYSLVR